ncbi:MAG: hypothetical protein GEV00_05400 [Actinophytocola sp.]|nr:hypothetical protein [Actinophytocola sp.]
MTESQQQPEPDDQEGQEEQPEATEAETTEQGSGKRKKTRLIVGITAALLLVAGAAVAVTGFWQPGYFLSDDTASQQAQANNSAAAQSPQGGTPEDVADVRKVAETMATAINQRDENLASQVSCLKNRQPDFSKAPQGTTASVTGEPKIRGGFAVVPFEITANGKTHKGALPAKFEGGSWCLGQ